MKDWFASLDDRERQFVSVGSVFVFIAIIYGLIWAPLNSKHVELQADVLQWERSINELKSLRLATSGVAQSQTQTRPASGQSPLIVVDQTLQSRGLSAYRRNSQPTTSNGIRVVFENVAFDDLIIWLGDLSEQHSMHVQIGAISVGSQASPGRINATLTLERVL